MNIDVNDKTSFEQYLTQALRRALRELWAFTSDTAHGLYLQIEYSHIKKHAQCHYFFLYDKAYTLTEMNGKTLRSQDGSKITFKTTKHDMEKLNNTICQGISLDVIPLFSRNGRKIPQAIYAWYDTPDNDNGLHCVVSYEQDSLFMSTSADRWKQHVNNGTDPLTINAHVNSIVNEKMLMPE